MFRIEDFLKPTLHETKANDFEVEVIAAAKEHQELIVATANVAKMVDSELDTKIQRWKSLGHLEMVEILESSIHTLDEEWARKSSVFVSISGKNSLKVQRFGHRVKSIAATSWGIERKREFVDFDDNGINRYVLMMYFDFK